MATNTAEALHAARAASPFMSADESVLKANLDRAPFALTHSLSGHPLFEMPRLLKLAGVIKRNPNHYVCDAGDVRVDQRWNQRPENPYTLEECIERVDYAGAWVILKHTEADPEYRALMQSVMSDAAHLSGLDLSKLSKNLEIQVMITSPNRVTPYHLDNECNFLLQIAGEKDIFIFDQTDREILTEKELERFWIGDWNAGEYKARCQEKARRFRLAPGRAVHIPTNAPHWVKNDANVSISVSINFEWKDESIPNIYRANYLLRSLGLSPRPPRQSKFGDAVKSGLMAGGVEPLRKTAWHTRRLVRLLTHSDRSKSNKKSAMA